MCVSLELLVVRKILNVNIFKHNTLNLIYNLCIASSLQLLFGLNLYILTDQDTKNHSLSFLED